MQILNKNLFLLLIILFSSNPIFGQLTDLMTYNIRYDSHRNEKNSWETRKEGLVKLLSKYNPSIVGIQEGLLNQVVYIGAHLPNYSYVGVGRDDGKTKGEYCAIFYDTTKYRVLEYSTFWLSETSDTVSVGWDAALERICTYGLFEETTTKEKIWVFNTHFDHIGKIARENSARLIIERTQQINKENFPIILMGDLNLTPEEQPIQIIKSKFKDALEISEEPLSGPIGTFNGFNNKVIVERIDYFFLKNLNVLSYSHIDERLVNELHISDHLPVLISIKY